jgi:hypothetical protein
MGVGDGMGVDSVEVCRRVFGLTACLRVYDYVKASLGSVSLTV